MLNVDWSITFCQPIKFVKGTYRNCKTQLTKSRQKFYQKKYRYLDLRHVIGTFLDQNIFFEIIILYFIIFEMKFR